MSGPTTDCVWVAITMENGPVRFMQFLTRGRGSVLPFGAIAEGLGGTGYWLRPPTPATIADEVARACPPQADSGELLPQPIRWTVVEYGEIQSLMPDRLYRDALVHDGKQLGHDMEKAKDIHRDRIREARAAKLVALDVAYQQADETGDAAAKLDVAAQKQVFRDLPADPAIDAALTIDDLRAFWPEELR